MIEEKKTITVVKTHAYILCTKDLENKKAKDGHKNEFAEGCGKSNSILKLEHFF